MIIKIKFFNKMMRQDKILLIFNLYSDGWIDADDLGCFKFLYSHINLFWPQAQQKCQSMGGYLAEPNNVRYGESFLGRGSAEVPVY